MRLALEALARNFETRQNELQKQGQPYLADGRASTLETLVVDPGAKMAWPGRAAAMLQGLELPGWPIASSHIDSHSYLAYLKCGPQVERRFADLTALVLYFDPLRRLEIAWIGLNEDVSAAVSDLHRETATLTNWSHRAPDYANALSNLR